MVNKARLPLASAFAVLVLSACPVRAAILPGEWLFSGGYEVFSDHATADSPTLLQAPSQTFSQRLYGSSVITGQAYYHFTPYWGLGLTYFNRTEKSSSYSVSGEPPYTSRGGTVSSTLSHEIFLATARYVFMPERAWNPYVFGGAGIDRVSIQANGFYPVNYGPYLGTTSISWVSHLLAGTAGFGIEKSVTGNIFTDVELGLLGIPAHSNSQLRLSSEIMPFLTARLGFDFGGTGRQ